jgi:hypothetical protein
MPYMTVRVSLNGQECGPFLVDTGTAAGLVLDPRTVQQLHLEPTGQKVQFNPGVPPQDLVQVHDVRLGRGERSVHGVDQLAVVQDLRPMALGGPPAAGIIGLPLLAQFRCRMDFDTRTLELAPAGEFRTPAPGTDEAWRRFGVGAALPKADGTTVPLQLMLDTGSLFTILPPTTVDLVQPKGRASLIRSSFTGINVGEELLIPELQVSGTRVPEVPVSIGNPSERPRVGVDLLSRYLVTLDVKRNELTLAPRASALGSRLSGYTGVVVEKREQEAIARIVYPGSPAAQAGVQEGDRLQTIDGRSPADLPRNAVQRLLDGQDGGTAKVELGRATGSVPVTFSRSSRFQAPLVPLVGATLRMRPNEPFRVGALRAGSPAVTAGLQLEDELLAINGLSTLTTPPAQFSLEFRRPTVVVTLKRKGMDQPLVLTLVAQKQ